MGEPVRRVLGIRSWRRPLTYQCHNQREVRKRSSRTFASSIKNRRNVAPFWRPLSGISIASAMPCAMAPATAVPRQGSARLPPLSRGPSINWACPLPRSAAARSHRWATRRSTGRLWPPLFSVPSANMAPLFSLAAAFSNSSNAPARERGPARPLNIGANSCRPSRPQLPV